MEKYEIVIGLEVHCELNTESKIYCSCRNSFGDKANSRICPVCVGLPGTLPVLNKKVVDYAVKMGLALNCRINNISRQDRKNYFYPDLPKAYQISQADVPLCEKGYVDIITENGKRRIGITRIHIEEDAGKLIHEENGRDSLVDLNRCGVPLIEIVTEPDLRSSLEARLFLEEIRNILRYINISDCKMQEGSIRCDVNVSVRKKDQQEYGTRCEMKNVNSFSAAVRAIEYEAARQVKILESGGSVLQETRRWDDVIGRSFLMRNKENAQDYRYFPEPDLGIIVVEQERIDQLKRQLPELPNEKYDRYMKNGISFIDAALLIEDVEKSELFDQCTAYGECLPKNVCNWILGDISKYLNNNSCSISQTKLTARGLSELIKLVESGKISNTAGKTVLEIMLTHGREPLDVVKELGLSQNSDPKDLEELAEKVIKDNEKSVMDYKNGKTNVLGYIVGQCMKASGGKANPKILRDIIENKLKQTTDR